MTTNTPIGPTTTTTRPSAAHRRMEPTRRIALAAGIAYLVTFAASIPQLKLFAGVIADPAGRVFCGTMSTKDLLSPSARFNCTSLNNGP